MPGMKNSIHGQYLPASRFRILTPFYDYAIRLLGDTSLKNILINQAGLEKSSRHRVIDVGCGTGTLAIMLKGNYPSLVVEGVDIDREVLDIAKSKATRQLKKTKPKPTPKEPFYSNTHNEVLGNGLSFKAGTALDLPYPANSIDHVFSSFVFHHLLLDEKNKALAEIQRVLVDGGAFHLLDFGLPHNKIMKLFSKSIQLIDGYERTKDNLEGQMPRLFKEADFAKIEETYISGTIAGTVRVYRSFKQ